MLTLQSMVPSPGKKRAFAAPQVFNSCSGLQATGETFCILLTRPHMNQQFQGLYAGWLPQHCRGMVQAGSTHN